MKFEKISNGKFKTAEWSHGKTTELYIYPLEADYVQRQFLWRVSSATVLQSPSEFTPLIDVTRWIMPLDGNLHLEHNSGGQPLYSIALTPYETHCFKGDWETHCEGTARDFNLMLKGRAIGTLSTAKLLQNHEYELGQIFKDAFEGPDLVDNRQSGSESQWTLGIISIEGALTIDAKTQVETFKKETLMLMHYQLHEIDAVQSMKISTPDASVRMVMFAVRY